MQRNSRLKLILSVAVSLVCIGIDRLTKLLCVKCLELGESVTVIPSVLRFTYIRNEGAAFGSLSGARWVFMIASVILIFLIVCYVISNRAKLSVSTVAVLAMLTGGGIGNMIDRIAYGYVIDFIDFIFLPFWKWIFNAADCFVCVAAVILVVIYIFSEAKNKKEKNNDV